jgi:hypothetical protein
MRSCIDSRYWNKKYLVERPCLLEVHSLRFVLNDNIGEIDGAGLSDATNVASSTASEKRQRSWQAIIRLIWLHANAGDSFRGSVSGSICTDSVDKVST